MKKRIPNIPPSTGVRKVFDEAIKENLEVIMAHRGIPLEVLATTATLDDVIAKVNAIIERLQ